MASNGNSNHCQFDPEIETVDEFLQRFAVQFGDVLHKVRSDSHKQAAVLIKVLPVKIITELQRRLKPVLLTAVTYDVLVDKLRSQFEVKRSVVAASVQFISRKQHQDEAIEAFALELNNLAAKCDYGDCCRDRLLRDTFVSGLHDPMVLSAVLQKCEGKSFNDCVEQAKLFQKCET